MPIAFLDVPPGITPEKKKVLFAEIYAALDQAYRVPDTRILLREWPNDMVSQDGRSDNEPLRPMSFLEVPPGIRPEAKRVMLKRISDAVADAYGIPDFLTFLREYPLDLVSQDGGLQSENPVILEAARRAMENAQT